jgi:hypothetical protein
MTVLHWWFATVPAWFWHHATHLNLGDLGGTWLGGLAMLVLWTGEGVLFLGYAVATLMAVAFLCLGVAAALKAFGRGFAKSYRKGAAR